MIANTFIKIYSKQDEYIQGQGQESTWQYEGRLFGTWRGSYGKRVIEAAAIGALDTATVRTSFHPHIYEKLQTQQCLIIKNGKQDAYVAQEVEEPVLSAYELIAGVENIDEANREMEFLVRRYQEK